MVARWCQQAENEFVGARVGIMDQYVACLGQPGHALLIDCRSLESRTVPVPHDVAVIVSNTMVKHSIAGGEYNKRRQQCEEAIHALRAAVPRALTLRDISTADLDEHQHLLTETTRKRARHVVSENRRVLAAADALIARDLTSVGRLMRESHESLRRDFEVSVSELDVLVDISHDIPGVYGSRMTGGGFGGSTVTLADAAAAERIVHSIRDQYTHRTGISPDVIVCTPSAGASEITA
jgi:galactokinase